MKKEKFKFYEMVEKAGMWLLLLTDMIYCILRQIL